jgi:hypothetical protein
MTSAIGCFQTGTFLLGCADAEESYQEAMVGQSVFCGGQLLPNSANRYNAAEPQLFVLTFFSVLIVNILWLWLMPADPRRHEPAFAKSSVWKSSREDTNYTKGHEF